MNILVTGSAGFVGSRLCQVLTETGYTVFGLCNDTFPKSSTWQSLQGNILDQDRMLSILVDREIDQVYHCAARAIVRNCSKDPVGCFRTNILGTATLLEACRLSDRVQGIMCMESDKSYGAGITPYKETQVLHPGGVYEASKACCGYVARSYHLNYDVPVFTIRSANVYGPNDPNQSRLVPNTVNRILRGELPEITPGADKFLREFIYIDDLVSIVTSLVDLSQWGAAINVGSGEVASVTDVVRTICMLLKTDFAYRYQPEQRTLSEIETQELDTTLLQSLLPDLPQCITLEEGLKRTVECLQ